MGFVDEDGLYELGAFAHDFAEDDGLFEEEDLKLFELLLAELGATVELSVQQQFALRCDLALSKAIAPSLSHSLFPLP